MNELFNWLKPRFSHRSDYEHKGHGGSFVALHMGGGAGWSMFDGEQNAKKGFCRNPVVYRCVSMISEAAASIPLVIWTTIITIGIAAGSLVGKRFLCF